MEEEYNYRLCPIHKIVYTDIRNKRVIAYVSEKSSQMALKTLEEALINIGYSEKNIKRMLPVSKKTECKAPQSQIRFKDF